MVRRENPNFSTDSQRLKNYFYVAFASAFGLGLSPIAPGTCGALIGVLIHIFIVNFLPVGAQLVALIGAMILVCLVHFMLTPWAIRYWGSKDPKNFVLDEVAGYLTVPILFRHGHIWQVVLWGFLLFRTFDIIKIPPARQIDKNMDGAWGILLDDIVSAIYAVIAMFVLMVAGLIDV